jgi:hypothetical protein
MESERHVIKVVCRGQCYTCKKFILASYRQEAELPNEKDDDCKGVVPFYTTGVSPGGVKVRFCDKCSSTSSVYIHAIEIVSARYDKA